MADSTTKSSISALYIQIALNPNSCINCTNFTTKADPNTLCAQCATSLKSDSLLFSLYRAVLPLYAFWIAFLRRTSRRKWEDDTLDKFGTIFRFHLGTPGVQAQLPEMLGREIEWRIEGVVKGQKTLDGPAQQMFEQVLLTVLQCDNAIMLMAELLLVHLVNAPNVPVIKVEELLFKPKHNMCPQHWTFRVTLSDQRQFAVNFTDRQLGWLPIVVPWKNYLIERVDKLYEVHQLGDWRKKCRREYLKRWQRIQAPPFDMVLEEPPAGWKPDEGLEEKELENANLAFSYRCAEKMREYYGAWEAEVEAEVRRRRGR
ncbi:hypothetical protein CC86DRAFT_408256 [Ophiobolus disseminans]|uniref:Uncharacterized protein n=1 Tax=Ophiobolus disseminans TaxID=1469910 RepID=A0A6A6ZSV3_9PLEO|nr:hypothetical protein CC86DRAFT_408256 [Ophiobolus disseminans]